MSPLGLILLIIILLMLTGSVPRWRHSSNWGYGPSGLLTIILIIVLVMALTGRPGWF